MTAICAPLAATPLQSRQSLFIWCLFKLLPSAVLTRDIFTACIFTKGISCRTQRGPDEAAPLKGSGTGCTERDCELGMFAK